MPTARRARNYGHCNLPCLIKKHILARIAFIPMPASEKHFPRSRAAALRDKQCEAAATLVALVREILFDEIYRRHAFRRSLCPSAECHLAAAKPKIWPAASPASAALLQNRSGIIHRSVGGAGRASPAAAKLISCVVAPCGSALKCRAEIAYFASA